MGYIYWFYSRVFTKISSIISEFYSRQISFFLEHLYYGSKFFVNHFPPKYNLELFKNSGLINQHFYFSKDSIHLWIISEKGCHQWVFYENI